MLIYQGTKQSFNEDVNLGLIADKIRDKYIHFLHRKPSAPEFHSWQNSMQYMRGVLDDNNIPQNAGIAIEYNVPPTGCRIDFMISGYDSSTKPQLIIIELKQWSECLAVEAVNGIYKVNTFVAGRTRDVNHPSYQAFCYAQLIRDYNRRAEEIELGLHPCAFLHNYYFNPNDDLLDARYQEYINDAPIFGHSNVPELRNFIEQYIRTGDDRAILLDIDEAEIRPSKMLQDSLAGMLAGSKEFYMIDSQKIVYEYALKYAKEAYQGSQKQVLIVHGGPGTGKSVLAINLLVELINRNEKCAYVTKNAAPKNVYAKILSKGHKAASIKALFQSSGNFINANNNDYDCLIVDEAHRLTEKSNFFGAGDNQVKEIIHAAKFSVFFIDENQRVTLKDIGSEGTIRAYALEYGAKVHDYELSSQFRCNGSDGYLAWLDNLLQIKETANFDIDGFNYDFEVFDSLNEMRQKIIEKNRKNNKSRIVAGYCWEWPSKGKANPDYYDIDIPNEDFKMSWNLNVGEPFAIAKDSINQVGCIHTVQGLEFDYVGVIIGDDLRYENERIITDPKKRAHSDASLHGLGNYSKEDAAKIADEIIKNTYRVLMTRGMKGCYVYCTDKNLAEYLRNYKAHPKITTIAHQGNNFLHQAQH